MPQVEEEFKFEGCEIVVFNNAAPNENVWNFEVRRNNKLIGRAEGDFESRKQARAAAVDFSRWSVAN